LLATRKKERSAPKAVHPQADTSIRRRFRNLAAAAQTAGL
jgi:hypothetical protein